MQVKRASGENVNDKVSVSVVAYRKAINFQFLKYTQFSKADNNKKIKEKKGKRRAVNVYTLFPSVFIRLTPRHIIYDGFMDYS